MADHNAEAGPAKSGHVRIEFGGKLGEAETVTTTDQELDKTVWCISATGNRSFRDPAIFRAGVSVRVWRDPWPPSTAQATSWT